MKTDQRKEQMKEIIERRKKTKTNKKEGKWNISTHTENEPKTLTLYSIGFVNDFAIHSYIAIYMSVCTLIRIVEMLC